MLALEGHKSRLPLEAGEQLALDEAERCRRLFYRPGLAAVILAVCLGLASSGCAFMRCEEYIQVGSAKARGLRIKTSNLAHCDCWPNTDRWYSRVVLFCWEGPPYRLRIVFCDDSRRVEAIKLIDVAACSVDGSMSAPAKPSSPSAERWVYQWHSVSWTWVSLLRFRQCASFVVDGLEWKPVQKGQRRVVLTIRFLIRRKTGDIEECETKVKLHRIVFPSVHVIES